MDLDPSNDNPLFPRAGHGRPRRSRHGIAPALWTLVSSPNCSLNSPFAAPYRPYLWICFRRVWPVNDDRSPREILQAAFSALWPAKLRHLEEIVRPLRSFFSGNNFDDKGLS